jgi:hypothetical protein
MADNNKKTSLRRPAPISHDSGASVGGASLADSHIFVPSLLRNLSELPDIPDEHELAPSRPHRLWKISDTALRPFPPYFPRDCSCSRVIRNTPPSVIAIRIAECLRRCSIAVEYDSEAGTATCLTVDRCHFAINLWALPDAILVEGMRTRGNVMSFHWAIHAVLEAAVSLGTGQDCRSWYKTSPLEYQRLKLEPRLALATKSDVSTTAQTALEQVLQMLRKDRLEAQSLGMERLVTLTDVHASGVETAIHSALVVLGSPIVAGGDLVLNEIHEKWIVRLLTDRLLPDEHHEQANTDPVNSFSRSCATSLFGENMTALRDRQDIPTPQGSMSDEHHGGSLRAMALRALVNSLSVLQDQQPKILESVLTVQSPHLVGPRFIRALVDDLQGASRPPAVVSGTRLASPHEAVLATRAIGILAVHNDTAKGYIVVPKTLAALEKARKVGLSLHQILAEEAKKTHDILTEDFRSC